MKRLLLILAVMLLLVGCTKQVPPMPNPTTQPTTPPVHYVPESPLEKQTGGAVRVYALTSGSWFGVTGLGSGVLLTGVNEMQVLTGEQGILSAKVTAESLAATSELDVTATGVAYYDAASCSVIVMNPQLQMTSRRELPETVVGNPIISLLRNEVYYIVGSEIRAMNLSTGISRLLRQQTGMVALSAAYFEGSVISCRIQGAGEQRCTEYISTETGQTLSENAGILQMTTCEDRYFLRYAGGRKDQLAFGTRTGEVKAFSADGDVLFPVLEKNGVVTCEETNTGISLSFFDLNTGKRTAQTSLNGVKKPASVYCDGTYIWLLGEASGNQRLLCWDVSKTAVQDDTVYTGAFYTSESPDTEGIQSCQNLADTYAQQYGIKINIWQNATITTGGYTVKAEYNPDTIRAMLEELRPILEVFPENFLLKTVEAGWIRINLVREIDGGKDWAHMWKGKDCHILISANGNAGAHFIRAVAYAIDSHVLGNSRDFDFDRWNPLNPAGFTYSNQPVKSEYLTGDTRAFADALAATSILEDRCSIFYNALIGGNTEMFKAPIMQAKLLRLCMGIREAYGLQKSEKNYLWERYLETSLAYKK